MSMGRGNRSVRRFLPRFRANIGGLAVNAIEQRQRPADISESAGSPQMLFTNCIPALIASPASATLPFRWHPMQKPVSSIRAGTFELDAPAVKFASVAGP